jgi:hypothetical protein
MHKNQCNPKQRLMVDDTFDTASFVSSIPFAFHVPPPPKKKARGKKEWSPISF